VDLLEQKAYYFDGDKGEKVIEKDNKLYNMKLAGGEGLFTHKDKVVPSA
jgi:hypothetical protein